MEPDLNFKTHRAFGVEQEHFLFDESSLPPTHEKIDMLWDCLLKDGYLVRARTPKGMVLSVERLTNDGTLVISNDSCTHIIEIAFPKMQCLRRFRDLYESTWAYLQDHLRALGLTIRFGGTINAAPREIHWRPNEKDPEGTRLMQFLERETISHPLFCRFIPSCIAATQVSLEIPEHEAIQKLPYFYSCEPVIPLNFSNSSEFQGEKAHCIRPLILLANFHQPYPLLGIPESIPKSLDEYEMMRSQCSGRDYSFVAIRDANRVEFRSACSQNTVEDVVRLIQCRLEIDLMFKAESPVETPVLTDMFRRICEKGSI
jgi:hypothetical protein